MNLNTQKQRAFTRIVNFVDALTRGRTTVRPSTKSTTGFTLIELLVVIAIIGILAAIVLASLNTARTKAKDSRVKEQMSQLRNQAEIYYAVHGDYGLGEYGYCTNVINGPSIFGATDGLRPLMVDIISFLPDPNNYTTPAACYATPAWGAVATEWGVSVKLPGGSMWCVDSTGAAKAGGLNGGSQCL